MITGIYPHRCDLVKAKSTTDVGYGHGSAPDWSSVSRTTVSCRFSATSRRELENLGFASSVRADYLLLVPAEEAPSGFGDVGSEALYRVENVKDESGATLRSGPLDIEAILPVFGFHGRHTMYRIALRGAE